MLSTKQRSLFWWLFTLSLSVAGVGLGGLLVGMALFPESNLLGGFGLIFGPLWWLGATLLVVVTLAWLGLRTVEWLKRKGV